VEAEIRTRRIEALGLETRVLEVGKTAAAEAVIFLHGQPGSADDWRDLMRAAAAHGRTIAFDWPGWGEADRPSRRSWDFSAGACATFLAALLSKLGVRRAHLVMHDLGGVGVLWGVAHPEAFASAVLIDTGVLLDFRWHPVARLMRAPIVGDTLLPLTNRLAFRAFISYYNPQPRALPAAVVDRWWSGFTLPTRRAMLAFYRATPEGAIERLRRPLAALDVPALVVWGAYDRAVPAVQAERQRESFPSARIAILEDSGHWPYLDDAEGTAALVIPFLESRLSARGHAASSSP